MATQLNENDNDESIENSAADSDVDTDSDSDTDSDAADVNPKDDEELIALAKKRFRLAEEAEANIRIAALDDLNFRAGNQWDEKIKRERESEDRPTLTINKLPQYTRQVTNDQRQNRSSIKVNPVDDKADIEIAKILQGNIRHIEDISNADVAYDTAFEGAATKGLGYFRVVTDFCDPNSFNQEIFIKRIRNSFTVYLDPHSQEPDGSDANWGFIFTDMSADDFRAQFKNSKMTMMPDWTSIGDQAPGWANKDSCRVAEYFYKTWKEVTIVQLSSGQVQKESEIQKPLPDGFTVVKKRKTTIPDIKWAKLTALDVLDRTDWLGSYIPIIPVIGDELDIDGERVLEGVIRHAKDPQRMLNYWKSAETETIALAPRAPWLVAEGQTEGYKGLWATANSKSHAYLPYKPTTISGQPVPPPQRMFGEPPVQAITNAVMQANDDIKSTTGIYDATLGNRSNENSGIAIERRNNQSQTSNFHLIDNLSRAKRHCGRILIDLIPKIYDVPMAMRTLGDDGSVDMVLVNQIFMKDGKPTKYDLSAGKYDVTVSTGPSFATKRQEAAGTMLEFTKSLPNSAPLISDLIARNMDWPGADEIADRLKKALPPGVADDGKDGKALPLPPQVQQQMQQMDGMIKQLTEHLNQANQKLETKTIELESKERIAFAQMQTNAEIELAKIGSKESIVLLNHQIQQITSRLNMIGMNEPIESTSSGQQAPQGQQPMNQSAGGSPAGQPTGGQPPAPPPMEG